VPRCRASREAARVLLCASGGAGAPSLAPERRVRCVAAAAVVCRFFARQPVTLAARTPALGCVGGVVEAVLARRGAKNRGWFYRAVQRQEEAAKVKTARCVCEASERARGRVEACGVRPTSASPLWRRARLRRARRQSRRLAVSGVCVVQPAISRAT
jgi:hypothetical protein